MDHNSGDRNYHGRLLWGYGELKGYPFASTKTAELTCEREGDQSKQKKSVGNREKVRSFFLQYIYLISVLLLQKIALSDNCKINC